MLAALVVLVVASVSSVVANDPASSEEPAVGEDDSMQIASEQVAHEAVARALTLRVEQRWRAWSIEVHDGTQPGTVVVRLRDESGRTHARELSLTAQTVDGRSRELASALALLIDQSPGDEPTTTGPPAPEPDSPPSAPPRTTGWFGIGPRAALNSVRSADPDIGGSVAGGTWLLRDHLHPVAEVTWSGWAERELRLDAVRFGAGVLGGGSTSRGRLWGGAGALVRAQWARATAATTATGWWASPAVVGVLQYRGRIIVAGTWLGVDLLFPPLYARGDGRDLRWSSIRPMAAMHVGVRLPLRRGGH